MRNVFLSAGHSNGLGKQSKDKGAVYTTRLQDGTHVTYVEGLLAIEFRDLLKNELTKIGVHAKTDDNGNALLQTLAFFKNLVDANSINIDIHFNSFGVPNKGTGVEVFIKSLKNQYHVGIASAICNNTANILGLKNRGVKSEEESARMRLGWMTLTGTNILLECCFINNDTDMLHWTKHKATLAQHLARVIKSYL